jgi:hypothetical protein
MRSIKMPQQQLPPPPPPSPVGPPPPAMMPVPPAPMPNQTLNPQTLPTSPVNFRAIGEQILGAHGARRSKTGDIENIPAKELPIDVVSLAQTFFSPNMMNLPPVKPITNQGLEQGMAPAMSTNKTPWGAPPSK